jgi:hypothetical protein
VDFLGQLGSLGGVNHDWCHLRNWLVIFFLFLLVVLATAGLIVLHEVNPSLKLL